MLLRINVYVVSYIGFWYQGPFYQHGLTLIPAEIGKHMPSKVWNEIAYPFPTSTVATLKFGNG